MKLGIIGVGIMGGAMAGHLLDAGHEVVGYDTDRSRVRALAERGMTEAEDAAGVAGSCEVVILSLPSAAAFHEVTRALAGSGVSDLLCIDTCTLPLSDKLEARDALSKVGVEMMDATLSGTGLQAEDATLVVFASGSPASFDRAKPVFEAIGRSSHYVGEFGNGSKMKYIANLLVSIHNLAAAEAHALGIAAGLDPATVQAIMEDGVGSSKIFEIRGPMMVADDYPPAARLDIILKDTSIITSYARSVGAPTPLLDCALDVYREASGAGLGDLDAAALLRWLEQQGGLTR